MILATSSVVYIGSHTVVELVSWMISQDGHGGNVRTFLALAIS